MWKKKILNERDNGWIQTGIRIFTKLYLGKRLLNL
jgi:hypothetical protein